MVIENFTVLTIVITNNPNLKDANIYQLRKINGICVAWDP